ncbi:MAG TPA: hypothetical protein PLO59_06045, partial [Bacteroidia bacterium]|nr:hypothetical protein [Bacteroidia bacterium]
KGNIKHSGASIAHVGVGLLLLGALISQSKQEVISQNVNGIDLGKDFPNNENIMLTKGDTLPMGNYYITYTGHKQEGIHIYYGIDYLKLNKTNGLFEKQFELKPTIQLNERMGDAAEPDTKHFIDKDLYTHVTYAELDKNKNQTGDSIYNEAKSVTIKQGDTITTSNSLLVLEGLSTAVDKEKMSLGADDIAVAANLLSIDVNNQKHYANPLYIIKDQMQYSEDAEIDSLGLKISFVKIDTEKNAIELKIAEKKSNKRDFVILKAVVFPHINILWMGCIIMVIGTVIAMRKRFADLKFSNNNAAKVN